MRSLFVLVAALVGLSSGALLAAAQDATPAPASTTTQPGGLGTGLVRTNVRYFLPFTGDGLNAGLTVVGNESGVCDAGSVSDPARPDAWLCSSTGVVDPCFQSPFSSPDEPGELACVASPFDTDVVLFTPTEPLTRQKETANGEAGAPADGTGQPGANLPEGDVPVLDATDLAELPWAIELANGDRCTFAAGATAVFAGMRLNYHCSQGSVLGDMNVSQQVWMATYLPTDGMATSLVEVAVGWY